MTRQALNRLRTLTAVNSGDVHDLMDDLVPDVVLIADGGGEAPAFPRPIEGMERVAAVLSS